MAEEADIPFKKGDAVQHKTGGPMMIFVGETNIGHAICSWMDNGKKHQEVFVFEELGPYTEPSGIFIG